MTNARIQNRKETEDLRIHLSRTIQDIAPEKWTELTGTKNVDQSYQWFRAVEDSRIRDMYYLFLKERDHLKAAVCCFPQYEKMYAVSMPFLEIRCPLGISNAFFSRTSKETELLMKEMEILRSETNTRGLLILDLKEEEHSFLNSQLNGFSTFQLYENTYIDLHFSDFDDYLQSLPAKARRSVRLTLNRSQRRGITSLYTTEFSRWKEVAHRLQGYICEEHHNFRWHLPLTFYEGLQAHAKTGIKLVFFFKDDVPLAFALSLNTPQMTQYKFVGVDPRYRTYEAYFLIYYQGIKKAIEEKQERIYFGPSTYEFKEKIGCQREPLYGLVKAQNTWVNLLLRSTLKGFSLLGKRI
jgi:predicted N-acyltransferase